MVELRKKLRLKSTSYYILRIVKWVMTGCDCEQAKWKKNNDFFRTKMVYPRFNELKQNATLSGDVFGIDKNLDCWGQKIISVIRIELLCAISERRFLHIFVDNSNIEV